MSIHLPLLPTDLCGCAAVVGWRNARSDLCVFLFCCAEGTMWDAEGLCRRYYVFHSKTKAFARIRHKLSLQLWLERGQIARSKADVARTREQFARNKGLVGWTTVATA